MSEEGPLMKKRMWCVLWCALVMVMLLPSAALAAREQDSDALFAGYVRQVFYPGADLFSVGEQSAGSRLTGATRTCYDAMVPMIEAIAAGERASTVMTVTTYGNEQPNLGLLIDALLADHPYELYWYDKTLSTPLSGSGGYSGWTWTISFPVSQAYRADDGYTVDTGKSGAAKAAAANAAAIVSRYAHLGDYDKLAAYRDEICSLVSYNDEAADDSSTPYGDPWQLIYVFDGDSATKVVCEGYSKAFQYLCDMSTWQGAVSCYCVSGYMSGSSGTGAHMWNVVTMPNGSNYLVDVTNSDSGTVGQGGTLFLAGYDLEGELKLTFTDGSVIYLDGYRIRCGSSYVGFYYDDATRWPESVLPLSAADYVKPLSWSVSYNLEHISTTGAATASSDADYRAVLTADSGYVLPDTISVTVGGYAISGYTYVGGVLTIPASRLTGDVVITAAAVCDHDWQQATCTQPRRCGACGLTDGEALGHGYDQPVFTWTEDCSGAEACFACTRCDHSETRVCAVTGDRSDAVQNYIASVTFAGRQYTDCRTFSVGVSGNTVTVDLPEDLTITVVVAEYGEGEQLAAVWTRPLPGGQLTFDLLGGHIKVFFLGSGSAPVLPFLDWN